MAAYHSKHSERRFSKPYVDKALASEIIEVENAVANEYWRWDVSKSISPCSDEKPPNHWTISTYIVWQPSDSLLGLTYDLVVLLWDVSHLSEYREPAGTPSP
jgi:hypothetical protein